MLFRSYTPAPPLGDFVHDIWLYDGYSASHLRERILPSGTIELVINLQENQLRIYDAERPERCERYSGVLVSGAYSRSFVSDTAEERCIMGVHFRPGGAFPFLGVPPDELADSHVNLEQLWGRSATELRERLCEAATPHERFTLVESALSAHLFGRLERHEAVSTALDTMGQSGLHMRVREMARRVRLSQRHFIQVFAAQVGLTPKLFYRIQRFQSARNMAHEGSVAPDWAAIALACGYFDQSHLIHDFVQFSGFTPAAYFERLRRLDRQRIHRKRNHMPLPV